jgi:uncharacterized protein YuzE
MQTRLTSIWFEEIRYGEVARSRTAHIEMDRVSIQVDVDEGGRFFGIEVLGASRVLRHETITAATDITGTGTP